MSYKAISILTCIKKINSNRLYLPAIQRKMVWDRNKIENLFESIYFGYPIGTFIFWKLTKSILNTYPFYGFLGHYHERDLKYNIIVPENIFEPNSQGVLDGQQRLNAFYIGLTGSYSFRKARSHWNNDINFIKTQLYFNIFHNNKYSINEKNKSTFRFINEAEANNISKDYVWIKVGEILNMKTKKDINTYYNKIKSEVSNIKNIDKKSIINNLNKQKNEIINNLWVLSHQFCKNKIIYFFVVKENEINKVVDIFKRVNSSGMILKKSDLMFSTLVSEWPEGRDKIEEVIKNLEQIGINVDVEFIMRICLTLSDLPVLYKESTFKNENNINLIKDNWPEIVKSLNKTAKLIKGFGFRKENLRSKNAIIPIAYYIHKDGNIKNSACRNNLRKYLVISQIKKLFGVHGDTILTDIRNVLRKEKKFTNGKKTYVLRNKYFNINQLNNFNKDGNKSFKVDKKFIKDKLLNIKKGADALTLLTLLSQHLDFESNDFQMDHIHPDSAFKVNKLHKLGLNKNKIKKFLRIKDCLPNLQLLTILQNTEYKKAKSLIEWLKIIEHNNILIKREYVRYNYIPDVNYEISNFEMFYVERRKLLFNKLKELLI